MGNFPAAPRSCTGMILVLCSLPLWFLSGTLRRACGFAAPRRLLLIRLEESFRLVQGGCTGGVHSKLTQSGSGRTTSYTHASSQPPERPKGSVLPAVHQCHVHGFELCLETQQVHVLPGTGPSWTLQPVVTRRAIVQAILSLCERRATSALLEYRQS